MEAFDFKKVNRLFECPCCGGNIFDKGCSCSYCGGENKDLTSYISKFREIISSGEYKKLGSNDFIKFIACLKKVSTSISDDEFIELGTQLGMDEILSLYQEGIGNKISKSEELSSDDVQILHFLNSNGLLLDASSFNTYMLRSVLLKKKVTDYDAFKEFINTFVCSLLEKFWQYPKCFFQKKMKSEDKKVVLGTYFLHTITLNEDVVNSLYQEGDGQAIVTIFHEYEHCVQDYYMTHFDKLLELGDCGFVLSIMKMSKDGVLRKHNKQFYTDNYEKLFSENEAEYCGEMCFLQIISQIGLRLKEDAIAEHVNKMKCLMEAGQMEERILDGKVVSLDEAFLQVATCSDLDDYPQLKLEYCADGERVRPKTYRELADDYELISRGNSSNKSTTLSTIELLMQKRKKVENNDRGK